MAEVLQVELSPLVDEVDVVYVLHTRLVRLFLSTPIYYCCIYLYILDIYLIYFYIHICIVFSILMWHHSRGPTHWISSRHGISLKSHRAA